MNSVLLLVFPAVFLTMRFLYIRYTWRKTTRACFARSMSFASAETREEMLCRYCSNRAVLLRTLRVFE